MLRNVLIGFALIAMISVGVAFGAETIQKQDALAAAEYWLTIIDKKEYAESCEEASEYFKTVVMESFLSG